MCRLIPKCKKRKSVKCSVLETGNAGSCRISVPKCLVRVLLFYRKDANSAEDCPMRASARSRSGITATANLLSLFAMVCIGFSPYYVRVICSSG